jgi:alkyl sulfatase BDS1-like metallo-beta-lactamase superfamily hydrolase
VAIEALATKLAGSQKRNAILERTVSCRLTDTDVTYRGELKDGHMQGITTEPGPTAQIRLTMTSDDLVALGAGQVSLGSAWLSGRMKVEGSILDLLKLKSLI